ncbi:MAG: hypothetical protein G01um101416_779 [Microgenomates group bacterium Gr01-1014_16]|nr:MAG: hypothetical protein G01um101416_779 [Microgenomates group bacterium Gr01-1014_16]
MTSQTLKGFRDFLPSAQIDNNYRNCYYLTTKTPLLNAS